VRQITKETPLHTQISISLKLSPLIFSLRTSSGRIHQLYSTSVSVYPLKRCCTYKASYYLTKVLSIISLEIALTVVLLLYVTSSGCILHYYKSLVSYKFVHSSRISCGSEKYRRAHRVIPMFPPKSFVCGGL